jgi:hypothetical protein
VTDPDITDLLIAQHHQIAELFDAVLNAPAGSREPAFVRLLQALATHESAEHIIVHRQARHLIDGGEEVVDALMNEELAISDAFTELESVPVHTDEFLTRLTRIRAVVDAHNRHEEADELGALSDRLGVDDHRRLTRAVEALSALGATGSEDEYSEAGLAPGSPNTMVGPFAAMLDRARQFVQHPRQ